MKLIAYPADKFNSNESQNLKGVKNRIMFAKFNTGTEILLKLHIGRRKFDNVLFCFILQTEGMKLIYKWQP